MWSSHLSALALSLVIKLRMCFIFIIIQLELNSKTSALITISLRSTDRYERGEARTVGNDWNQREEIKEEGLGIHSEHKHRLRLFSQAPYAAQTPPPGCKIMTQKSLRSLLVALLVSSSSSQTPANCLSVKTVSSLRTSSRWTQFKGHSFGKWFTFLLTFTSFSQ